MHGSIHASNVSLLFVFVFVASNRCDNMFNGMGGIIKWLFEQLLRQSYSSSWEEFDALDTHEIDIEDIADDNDGDCCEPQRTPDDPFSFLLQFFCFFFARVHSQHLCVCVCV
jgi:hypothetical protein